MTDHFEGAQEAISTAEHDALAGRALAHLRDRTTDQADSTMRMPVSVYLDAGRYRREVDRLFHRTPVSIALSLELAEPGTYLACTIIDVPVLLTRDGDGKVHAFLNVCRHRGARLCNEGSGQKSRFSCPYHAWTYENDGRLTSVYAEKTFGSVDRAALSLTKLTSTEQHGLIWVVLTPGIAFDIDEWLGDFGSHLASLELNRRFLAEVHELPGAGWKATLDGYHHNCVHKSTVGKHTIGNLLVHDTFGPHQRLTFARPSLRDHLAAGIEAGEGLKHLRMIHSAFPNLSISGILGEHCLVSQIWPGPTPDTTLTRQFLLTSMAPTTAEHIAAIEDFSKMTLQAVRDEDYAVVRTIQDALACGANKEFVYGRNEPGIQHYHSWVARFMDADAQDTS